VSLENNRLAPDVDLRQLAQRLEGYTGSDIKEVCREAVVRVAHECAAKQERGDVGNVAGNAYATVRGFGGSLRPVLMSDFDFAIKRLKSSIDETGSELQKVYEWNKKYGESRTDIDGSTVRKLRKSPYMSMYI
jgi:SpoVK/Ycf46/Vps4 family AAA+-type ATPase